MQVRRAPGSVSLPRALNGNGDKSEPPLLFCPRVGAQGAHAALPVTKNQVSCARHVHPCSGVRADTLKAVAWVLFLLTGTRANAGLLIPKPGV